MNWDVFVNDEPVKVDQQSIASAEEVEPGVYSVLHEGRSYQARIVPAQDGWSVEVKGRTFEVDVFDPRDMNRRSSTALGSTHQEIKAPMPGKVIRVLVKAGQIVEAGQGLVVVEAMKMQNEMKAAHDGTVLKVHAGEGDTVSAGQVLVTLE